MILVGTQDTYYLNEGVKAFQDTVERLSGSTDNAAPPEGQPEPDLSATRGNRWADASAHGCATRTPAHGAPGDAVVGSTLTADPASGD